jgi:hypothetical protein
MTALNASTVPLAVRVKNGRYDGMLTGYLHGGVKFQKSDPGGFKSASFVVSQRLGFRTDLIQPYSRIYIFDQRGGECVFEGDVTHPGRSVTDDGALLEVQVDMDRLHDWSGARIFVDRDMEAWNKTSTAMVSTTIEVNDDRGGSGVDALNLAFPTDTHVENTHRAECGYYRIREAGQELGRINYSWDAGLTNASWLARLITTPPSTASRAQSLTTAGAGGSGAVVGGSIPVGANVAYLQLIWTGAPSSTGASGADVVWLSILDPVVMARLHLKDGSFKTSGYADAVTAVDVWEDMLGDMLADSFDGPGAQLDAGTGFVIQQFAFPDGTTPADIAEELTRLEPACTYVIGPSSPLDDKYSIKWVTRSTDVRYELMTWIDEHTGGVQPVEQYDVAVARWKTPVGNIRYTTSTQSIPEMAAAGRSRRYFQDLGTVTAADTNATQANSAVLNDHRYPRNGGQVKVQRAIVDLFTGRRVQPYQIEPGYLVRMVGINPSVDALNNSPRNGSTICQIVNTDYDSDDNSVTLDLDSLPWSVFRAIAAARARRTPQRKAF